MEKLNQLRQHIGQVITHIGINYLCFQSKTGEPHTVIQAEVNDQQTLIVSGSTPGGGVIRNSDVLACCHTILTITGGIKTDTHGQHS